MVTPRTVGTFPPRKLADTAAAAWVDRAERGPPGGSHVRARHLAPRLAPPGAYRQAVSTRVLKG
jgi:hypothetical protein